MMNSSNSVFDLNFLWKVFDLCLLTDELRKVDLIRMYQCLNWSSMWWKKVDIKWLLDEIERNWNWLFTKSILTVFCSLFWMYGVFSWYLESTWIELILVSKMCNRRVDYVFGWLIVKGNEISFDVDELDESIDDFKGWWIGSGLKVDLLESKFDRLFLV